jgi:hypothetical protein
MAFGEVLLGLCKHIGRGIKADEGYLLVGAYQSSGNGERREVEAAKRRMRKES